MTLAERMKEYELQSRTRLLRRTPVIIRIDGKAFSTFTQGLNKPFDKDLVFIMQKTMLELCKNIQGCIFGYTQSDEITLVLIDYQNRDTCAWFDNQVQKIVSVSASMATLYFNKALYEQIMILGQQANYIARNNEALNKANVLGQKVFKANFDSRAFNVPKEEVINNLIWRQQDAVRNSIQALGQSLFSDTELDGVNMDALKEKMLKEKNVNWDDLPQHLKHGSCAIKDSEGKWYIDNNIPTFTEDRDYIDKLVFLKEER